MVALLAFLFVFPLIPLKGQPTTKNSVLPDIPDPYSCVTFHSKIDNILRILDSDKENGLEGCQPNGKDNTLSQGLLKFLLLSHKAGFPHTVLCLEGIDKLLG